MAPEYFRLVELYQSQDSSVLAAFIAAALLLLGLALIRRAGRVLPWLPNLYAGVLLFVLVTANLVIMSVSL
jgi:hypothetical protein